MKNLCYDSLPWYSFGLGTTTILLTNVISYMLCLCLKCESCLVDSFEMNSLALVIRYYQSLLIKIDCKIKYIHLNYGSNISFRPECNIWVIFLNIKS